MNRRKAPLYLSKILLYILWCCEVHTSFFFLVDCLKKIDRFLGQKELRSKENLTKEVVVWARGFLYFQTILTLCGLVVI